MTDAEDNGSKVQLKEAIEAAQRADAVIHVLLISDRSGYLRRAWATAVQRGQKWRKIPAAA